MNTRARLIVGPYSWNIRNSASSVPRGRFLRCRILTRFLLILLLLKELDHVSFGKALDGKVDD